MTWLESHKFTLTATVLATLLAGCTFFPVRTSSPIDGRKVTREELAADFQAVSSKFKAAGADLDRKEQFVADVASVGMTLANAYAPGAGNLLAGFFGLTTLGAATDNVLTRRRAKAKKPVTIEK